MGRARGTWSAGVWWEHPVWAKFTCPFPTPVTCALLRKSTTRKKCDHTWTTDPHKSEIPIEVKWSSVDMMGYVSRPTLIRFRKSQVWVTYLWVCVSLLIEASAALHCGHFTLMLICGRTVCQFSERYLKSTSVKTASTQSDRVSVTVNNSWWTHY